MFRSERTDRSPLFDLVVIVLITAVSAWLFGYLEMNEQVFAATRRWESLQLDEVPAVLLVLALCLTWFAGRRHRDASAELARRRQAEARLTELLHENRRLAQQHVDVLESERKHLARELHDEAGQYLNAIKTDAVSIQSWAAHGPDAIRRASAAIVDHTDRVYGVVRDLISRLRPVGLDELGVTAALEHYVDHSQQRLPQLKIVLSIEGELDDLDEQRSLTVYRLVQEALTNVGRHAGATRVDIQLTRQAVDPRAHALVVRIKDDGKGADLTARSTGLGLVGMRERVEVLGGQLRLKSTPAHGFEIVADIPFGAPAGACES
jgi:two-component system, NarL family, sensor histidine kinase UhpB